MSSTGAPTPPPPTPPPGTPRWLWVLIFTLTAIIVGGTAGLLAHAGGTSVPGSILTCGGAFAGTVGLLLAIAHYASGE